MKWRKTWSTSCSDTFATRERGLEEAIWETISERCYAHLDRKEGKQTWIVLITSIFKKKSHESWQ